MTYSNAALKAPFPPGESSEKYDQAAYPSKSSNVVLSWPGRQPGNYPEETDETKRADEILRKLGYQAPPPGRSSAEPDDGPLLLVKRSSERASLQEEMPLAIQAYEHALAIVKEHFPVLSIKRTLHIAPLEQAVALLVESLERNHDALLCIAKIREPNVYIFAHAINVCIYSAALALDCGKSRAEAINTGLAGLLHDTGMALLPIALLQSSRQLTPTEQVLVKRHPVIACDLLASLPNIHSDIFSAALEHHERYDGSGYPAGLSGSEISFIGHLMGVCSAFDAMTSSRRHKVPVSTHIALAEMFKQRNKQFHAVILESFIMMMGIYPVGSAVVLKDGYCGIVTASARKSPRRPVVTLVKDPKGHPMPPLEFDMAKEPLASISQCVSPIEQGLDVNTILGITKKK